MIRISFKAAATTRGSSLASSSTERRNGRARGAMRRSTTRHLAALLLASVLLGAAPGSTESLETSGEARVGAAAPWFAGWTPSGRVFNRTAMLNSKARGYIVILAASWCAPCEVGMKLLAAERPALSREGVQLVVIAVSDEGAKVRAWLAGHGMSDVDVILDDFGRVAETLGARASVGNRSETSLPRTLVLDAQGNVRAIFGREGPDFVERLRTALAPPPFPE